MRALIVDAPHGGLLTESQQLIHQIGWEVTRADDYAAAIKAAESASFDALLVPAPSGSDLGPQRRREFDRLIDLAEDRRMAAVILADRSETVRKNSRSLVDTVDRSISASELKGRLEMIERYQPVVQRLDREIDQMQKLARRLDRHFREVDQEMRLAGRLQRDFLPKIDQPIQDIQFATVYRPALWVSGDTFDVFRVSEDITAFYVADAVGHGMAASLLTMFIRRAIVAKQIKSDGYDILTPSETLAILNTALMDQQLPNSQFVTACYMLIDHRTMTIRFARGGHPYPIVISADGSLREAESIGGLLGIFDGAEFPTCEIQLQPNDKLIIYTDGLEIAFGDPGKSGQEAPSPLETFRGLASLPIQSMMTQLESKLDRAVGSLDPSDDVTVVGFEWTPS